MRAVRALSVVLVSREAAACPPRRSGGVQTAQRTPSAVPSREFRASLGGCADTGGGKEPSATRRTFPAMTRRTWNETAIEAELLEIVAALGRFPKRAELTARGVGGLWNAMQRNGGIDAWRARVSRAAPPSATAAHESAATAVHESVATTTDTPTATATRKPTLTAAREPTVTATREPTVAAAHEPTVAATHEPTVTATHEQIATRAYFLAQERGGDPMENWLAAEQEL